MREHCAVLVMSGTLINGKVSLLHESLVNAVSYYVKGHVFMRPLRILQILTNMLPSSDPSGRQRGLRRRSAAANCELQSRRWHVCLSVVSVVCCQVRQTEHSYRVVLPTVLCLRMIARKESL
jgi:hypothetical protein